MAPGVSSVVRAVDALAVGDVTADAGLAGADVDDVGVRLRDGNRADGEVVLRVEEGRPGLAGVVAAEDPTCHRSEVKRERLPAPAAKRPNRALAHPAEEGLGDLRESA